MENKKERIKIESKNKKIKDKNTNEKVKVKNVIEVYKQIKYHQLNAKELSDILGVSQRTITSYIKELRETFDVKIKSKKNNGHSYYHIEDHGDFEDLMSRICIPLEERLLVAAALIKIQPFMITTINNIINKKLLESVKGTEKEKITKILALQTLGKIDVTDEYYKNIKKIYKGIFQEKKLVLRYRSAGRNISSIKVIPYLLVEELGKYYLICKKQDSNKMYHYRVDRISEVILTQEKGQIEKEFNALAYLKGTWYMYAGEETRVQVRFKKKSITVVEERNMCQCRQINQETINEETYYNYEFTCFGTEGIKLWILGFGQDAEVLSPLELRNSMKEIARDMVAMYCE